ncbi:hypothetical protein Tco_1215154 [Tanacetum coccineum]
MDEDVSSDDDRDHTNLSMIAKSELKIGDEFLKISRDNSFNGMDGMEKLKNGGTVKEQLLLGKNWAMNSSINITHCPIPTKTRTSKSRLWEFYVNGRTKRTLTHRQLPQKPWQGYSKTTCSEFIFTTLNLDAQDGNAIYGN